MYLSEKVIECQTEEIELYNFIDIWVFLMEFKYQVE